MWGHGYVDSHEAIVLHVMFVCCAMHHVGFIDIIVS